MYTAPRRTDPRRACPLRALPEDFATEPSVDPDGPVNSEPSTDSALSVRPVGHHAFHEENARRAVVTRSADNVLVSEAVGLLLEGLGLDDTLSGRDSLALAEALAEAAVGNDSPDGVDASLKRALDVAECKHDCTARFSRCSAPGSCRQTLRTLKQPHESCPWTLRASSPEA